MKVIAGKYKGRKLQLPLSSSKTRPTTAQNREAWASIVLNNLVVPIEEAVIVDAFAGSGALGIELLSRGAKHCTFVELEPKTVSILRQNTSFIDESSYTIYKGNSLQNNTISKVFAQPADILVLDPPYTFTFEQVEQYLSKVLEQGGLGTGALLSYEHRAAKDAVNWGQTPFNLPELELLKQYKSGACAINFYKVI